LEVHIILLRIHELKNVNKNYDNLLMYINAVSVCAYFNLLTLKLSDVYTTLIRGKWKAGILIEKKWNARLENDFKF